MIGMTGTAIDLIWVIPALPLAAIILNFFVLRWFDVASQRPHPPAAVEMPGGQIAINPHVPAQELYQEEPGTTHPTGPAGHGLTPPQVREEHEAERTEEHGGHGAPGGHAGEEHGGIGGLNIWATLVSLVSLLAVLASLVISGLIGYQFLTDPTLQKNGTPTFALYPWFSFGNLSYSIDFRIDTLTVVMLIVVTGVSTLVHLYSIGYMAKDPGYSRFFIELSLFTFSMLILVLGANFLVLFIGWELVGLSSYLLIGFFYGAAPPPRGSEVPYPPPAQLKAFVTTRLGDFGFLIGILILWTLTGTFSFTGEHAFFTSGVPVNVGLVTVAMILVFCGAVGKSAQFPLHVWLPDAMAGPTPVSALIHAATMVAAGVYLVARLFPLYAAVAGPQAMLVVGYIGGFTALFAASIALTQYDIKGVLAYSTISQLGYMFVGLAMASTNAIGMNHLFTHAFFKALLFLGSGAVIHAIANQDMRFMGGLARFLPITALTMLVATLAISGIPPFSGFWSKDPIIAAALDSGQPVLYAMTLFTAFLTAFYMFRLYFLTFGGPGGAIAGFWGGGQQYRGEAHPHAPAWVMWLPLAVLALVTIAIGLWGFAGYNSAFATFLNGGVTPHEAVTPGFDDPLTLIGIGVAVVGVLLAWAMYGLGVIPRNAFTSNPVGAAIHKLLYNRYYLNELYIDVIVRYVVLGLAGACAWFDAHIIDGIVNGSARGVLGVGRVTRRTETGFLQNYGAAIFGGALLLMLIIFIAVGALSR